MFLVDAPAQVIGELLAMIMPLGVFVGAGFAGTMMFRLLLLRKAHRYVALLAGWIFGLYVLMVLGVSLRHMGFALLNTVRLAD